MPGKAGDAMADSPWYSFDFGPVHFTVISTEHDFTTGSEQVRSRCGAGVEQVWCAFLRLW